MCGVITCIPKGGPHKGMLLALPESMDERGAEVRLRAADGTSHIYRYRDSLYDSEHRQRVVRLQYVGLDPFC